MLALTKKTDYALIALSELARRAGSTLSAREIAERYGVPLALLTNVLKVLTRAGIVQSERGASGGYRLSRTADEINLYELIMALEGPIQFVRCVGGEAEPTMHNCELEPSCPIRLPAHRIRERLAQLLKGIRLSELVGPTADKDGPLAKAPVQLGISSERPA